MKVTVAYFKDNDKQWASLLLDNISVCQEAVKDIVGASIIEQTLHAHGLYDQKDEDNFINVGTGKIVFRNLCEKMYDKKVVVMNMHGGHTELGGTNWNIIETKDFVIDYKSNLLDLLKQENGIIKETFKEVGK